MENPNTWTALHRALSYILYHSDLKDVALCQAIKDILSLDNRIASCEAIKQVLDQSKKDNDAGFIGHSDMVKLVNLFHKSNED